MSNLDLWLSILTSRWTFSTGKVRGFMATYLVSWREKFHAFRRRHPALVQAALWAIPAIIFGLVLRAIFLIYQPLAYWGSDSESYFHFAYRALHDGVLSLPQKRRYLYPILLLPISLLPGSPLKWLALFQHAMGLATIIPLAYVVRKIFIGWRWWVIPLTAIYAGMPIILWYEHELLGEALFFASLVWVFAAWVAWVHRTRRGDAGSTVWWIFFSFLAIFVLTKPSARFFWPGLLIGFAYVRAWRFLKWQQWTALAALIIVMLVGGEKNQAVRLLYSSVFPLTVLDSPKHSELKADIAPLVRESRSRLDYYYLEDNDIKRLLRGGYRNGPYPAWQALRKREGENAVFRAMKEMALEAIFNHPLEFLYIGTQRAVGALNWTTFKLGRFHQNYLSKKFSKTYAEAIEENDQSYLKMVAFVYDIPESGPPPPFAEIQQRAEPFGEENNIFSSWMNTYVRWMSHCGVFVKDASPNESALWEMQPTILGWWLILGCILSFLVPSLRPTLGVWLLIAIGYALGVHLVGSSNPRFFAAVWPPLILALAVPLDGILRLLGLLTTLRRRQAPPQDVSTPR